MKRVRMLGAVVLFAVAAAAVGCGGASSAPKPQDGTDVNKTKGKGASDKGGASLEKFDSVPPPPR